MGDKGTIILDYVNGWFYPEGDYKTSIENVDGVSGATIKWDKGKGIPIEVEHADPSEQALMDFRDNILNNTTPQSNVITGSETAVCVQMAIDAMENKEVVNWNNSLEL